jgi:hypothetical protein
MAPDGTDVLAARMTNPDAFMPFQATGPRRRANACITQAARTKIPKPA